MQDWLPAPVVGGVLLLIGVLMMQGHVRAWRRQQDHPALDDFDRRHYHARYRRRMQTAGLLVLLGVLIPLGDALIPARAPGLFGLYVVMLLLLTLWVILLALADLMASRAHARVALARVRQKQRELEQQLAEFKSRTSNGRRHE